MPSVRSGCPATASTWTPHGSLPRRGGLDGESLRLPAQPAAEGRTGREIKERCSELAAGRGSRRFRVLTERRRGFPNRGLASRGSETRAVRRRSPRRAHYIVVSLLGTGCEIAALIRASSIRA